MTREEREAAISTLEYIKEYCHYEYEKETIDKVQEALEQEPCADAVSIADVFEIMGNLMSIPYDFDRRITEKDVSESMDEVRELPRITPQEPRKGHWIISPNDCFVHCSECGLHGDKGIYKHYGWCPNCGAKMVDPQESEGKYARQEGQ